MYRTTGITRPLSLALSLLIAGCATHPGTPESAPVPTPPPPPATTSGTPASCPGSSALPPALAAYFVASDDPQLLANSLGAAEQGKLCQGQVYQATRPLPLYRAWNSTNPGSRLGNWWAASRPAGSISAYRADYEICYQWSPLDQLVTCTLQPGSKVVIGTGQSAQCSSYLSYPASATQQVYLESNSATLNNCADFSAEFSWRPL